MPLRVLLVARGAAGATTEGVVALQEAASAGRSLRSAVLAALGAGASYCREACGVVLAERGSNEGACSHEAVLHGVRMAECEGLSEARVEEVYREFCSEDGWLYVSLRRLAGATREML